MHRLAPLALRTCRWRPSPPTTSGCRARRNWRRPGAAGPRCDGIPGEDEGNVLGRRHGELGHRRHVLAAGLDGRPQRQRVGAGDGAQQAVGAPHPGDRSTRSRSGSRAPCAWRPRPGPLRPSGPPGGGPRGWACSRPPWRRPWARLELGLEHQGVGRGSGGGPRSRRSPAPCASTRACRSPRSWAKHASESNRGRHSQSIDPLRPTSAAVWVSPMMPVVLDPKCRHEGHS